MMILPLSQYPALHLMLLSLTKFLYYRKKTQIQFSYTPAYFNKTIHAQFHLSLCRWVR